MTGNAAIGLMALLLLLAPGCALQADARPPAPATSGTGAEVSLDRVVAIVNGDLVLESDVEAEGRFSAFQPFTQAKPFTQDELLKRLIDRTLIQQQMTLQPGSLIDDAEVDAELILLRKAIPKCAAYQCDTEAGWAKFVAEQGFTVEELRERWRLRMEVLRFIVERFRMGIDVPQAEVHEYYLTKVVPVYQKSKTPPPTEASVTDRIHEVLLQERVDKLLDDWLVALRAQGTVRILKPGEEAP
jgi:peptidyl-prolyl cis-trans isomerase SurA